MRFWFFVVLVSLVKPIHAKDVCPWFNSATAAGVLEAPVTVSVTYSDKDQTDGVCQFVRKSEPSLSLLIKVTTMANAALEFKSYLAQCGSKPAPVRAIGNEAVVCSISLNNTSIAEQIVSRVRERALVISVTSDNQSAARPALRKKALEVADQVAGNLF